MAETGSPAPLSLQSEPSGQVPARGYLPRHKTLAKTLIRLYGGNLEQAREHLAVLWGPNAADNMPSTVPATQTLREWNEDPFVKVDEVYAEDMRQFARVFVEGSAHRIVAAAEKALLTVLQQTDDPAFARNANQLAIAWGIAVDKLVPKQGTARGSLFETPPELPAGSQLLITYQAPPTEPRPVREVESTAR